MECSKTICSTKCLTGKISRTNMQNFARNKDYSFSNTEKSHRKIQKNKRKLEEFHRNAFYKFETLKRYRLEATKRKGDPKHYYDDDVVSTIAEEFLDRFSVIPVIGDLIRFSQGINIHRIEMESNKLIDNVISKIKNDFRISRNDIADFSKVKTVSGNFVKPIMNGGHVGENWNTAADGFYSSVENSKKSIIGIELGFKADDYGIEVSKKLIKKKQDDPEIHISILIDGFVSIFIQKPLSALNRFQCNTVKIIREMKQAGINVKINDSHNPMSSDFLAVNHVKLWIFDGEVAFYGGIGIESQFRKRLFDQMDLVRGPFVNTLTSQAIMMLTNQKRSVVDKIDKRKQIYELSENEIRAKFFSDSSLEKNGSPKKNVSMELSMNIPGLIQDCQKDYIELFSRKEISKIFIMTPYFSDDKIARALVKKAASIYKSMKKKKTQELKNAGENISSKRIDEILASDKRVYIIFPKKQENAIIEQVSKYYAYAMRKNPIVKTLQYVSVKSRVTHEMLHAKQMVVVLEDESTGWKKYVKFGGSYNPAGRAHNMWEINAKMYENSFSESDGDQNIVKKYLDNVIYDVIENHSEDFKWGKKDIQLKWWEKIIMRLAPYLPF